MKEINEQENGKHSTCHSEWHGTNGKLYMTTGTKGGLTQQGHIVMDYNMWPL